ncbi:MAG: hypothetical protein ACKOXB_06390 [Flavobacteriales bacterium]
MATCNEKGERIYLTLVFSSDVDDGKWTSDTIKNTISFKPTSVPETYTFQIIRILDQSSYRPIHGTLIYRGPLYYGSRDMIRLIRIK